MMQVERLTDPVDAVGESPVWRAAEGALYWVDIPGRCIRRLHVASGKVDTWRTDEMAACIAFDMTGAVIAGMQTGVFSLTLGVHGSVGAVRLAAADLPMPGMRFNDGRCDRQGRFWAGTMHTDMAAAHAVGSLYRYTAQDGLSAPVVDRMLTQNGLAWSPTGDRMYLSDSHPRVQLIWVFDYDTATGTPSNQRIFADMNQYPGRPDGAAVDVEGCYWTCANDAGLLLRFTPDGVLDRRIELPVKKPTMCAFGGANWDTLFVTSIRPQNGADLQDQPLAGAVFAVQAGVQGLPETDFGSAK